MVNKLLERAYLNAPPAVTKVYKDSQEERDLFMKYNNPLPVLESPHAFGYSPFAFAHLRYLPQTASPSDKERHKLAYPVLRRDLGFFPQLAVLQRFTQNVYSVAGDSPVEEKDMVLRSTRPIAPAELRINTPESLEDYALFKNSVEAEAFRR